MNRDDIIRMAREAGCDEHYVNETDDIPWSVEFSLHNLEAFVALVAACGAAAEREAICPIVYGHCGSDNDAQRIVEAVRGRGEK